MLFHDLRYAARSVGRSPGFSAAIVLTLALGVGTSAAIFSVVYGLLFRPLPYRDADRLAVVRMERVVAGVQRPARALFPLADLADFQSSTHAFESVAFYSTDQVQLSHVGFTETVGAASVSGSFFSTVGGRLQSGRGLAGDDDRTAAVISDRLRQRLFGAGAAIGQVVGAGGRSYEIIGVAHPSLQLPTPETDIWLPAINTACCPYAGIARLKAGISQSQASADVNALLQTLASRNPRVHAGAHAAVVSVRDELTGDVRAALWVLLAAVGLVFAVACANVTNLLFARNVARSRETAVRIALGASRSRLSVQSLAEAALLAMMASVLGIVLAMGIVNALMLYAPAGLPRLDTDTVRIDLPVFIFASSIGAATTMVMGLLPAIRSRNPVETMRTGSQFLSADPHRRRLHQGLVIVQLACSVVLLVGAGLLGRSLVRLITTDLGVRTDHVATAALNLSYRRELTDAQQTTLVDAMLQRVRSLPGVQAAGAGAGLPPSAGTFRLTLKRFGDTVDYQAAAVPATPGYFSALGMQLLKGRLFTDADVASERQVMIMTADTARRFFDTDDPIGRTMTLPFLRNGVAGSVEATLVGVISNVKYSGLQAAPDDAVYRPLAQQSWPLVFLVARTSGEPEALASLLRREIAAIDPAVAVSAVNTLDAIVSSEAAHPRFRSALLSALAALTLLIAAVGLYASIAHTMSQRMNELGIRMALGADRRDLLTLVFLEGARLTGAGLALGIVASLATARILSGLLYGIEPTDMVSFALAAGLMVIVAAAAIFVSAHKAASVDPVAALRAN